MWLDEVPRGMRRALFVLYGSDANVSVYTYIYFFAHDPFIRLHNRTAAPVSGHGGQNEVFLLLSPDM